MAEAPLKRQREEVHDGEDYVEDTKRHKSYSQILSLLETEEEVPIQDLSFLMSTLEHELSCDSIIDPLVFFTSSDDHTTTIDPENPSTASSKFTIIPDRSTSSSTDINSLKEEEEEEEEEEEDDKERVIIRHLLEASDDELGIPQAEVVRYINGEENDEINGESDGFFSVSVCHGLWELEDEAANYYTYLQSQLFM